ncbi:MAG: DEAD/DEAH box helicase [Oscillospiraceae bacterium]|nr:DEAD/DEAH box helicase [Oscillospiraceae bacterium]
MQRQRLSAMTTVQAEAIPALLDWKDVIAKAPTGTGKTIAFAIPILEHIDPDDKCIQALILCPTRELTLQICDEIRKLSLYLQGIRTVAIYGGQKIDIQMKALKQHPQIVVATPGRLKDHLDRHTIRLDCVHTVVLDEADRMLDMGFVRDVTRILDRTENRRHLALMSATISREVMDIAWVYQKEDAVEIRVQDVEDDKPPIEQYSIEVRGNKTDDMLRVIRTKHYHKVIIFCNTKHLVHRLTKNLVAKGCRADCIHGDIQQSTRERVMATFRKGGIDLLVATDVAARGLDISGVDAVFNYDIPNENEYYLHRIGRTGRAKQQGVSYTFFTPFDAPRLKEIAKYTKSQMVPLYFDASNALVPRPTAV